MTDLAMLRRAGLRVEDSTHDAAPGTITLPRRVMPGITGWSRTRLDQAALDFATWVAIASIKAGDRQS
jgi:hypothetical protein